LSAATGTATPPARLSAVLIVHNEERRLPACLESLKGLADEIIVLDDGSSDATVAIATAAGARVSHRPFDDFGRQKQAALELATGEWILSIDADERVTPALEKSIRKALEAPGDAAGFRLNRQIIYLGFPLRHGGAENDRVVRLALRNRVHISPRPIHEHLVVDGPVRDLKGALDHVKYENLSEHMATIDRYTGMIAADKRRKGERFRMTHVLRVPIELLDRLILKRGILDGRAGVIHAGMAAFYAFLKYAKLWTEERKERG
jgi:glycosyltransferase involved in cell wall biosynthesis